MQCGGRQLIKVENILVVQDAVMAQVNWILVDMEYLVAYKYLRTL